MSAAVPNHRRTKPGGIKAAVAAPGVTGPTSQIPGLSQSAEAGGPAERISCRRVGIFDTDSDYTKLAKGGGHKGLLSMDGNGDADDKPRKLYNPSSTWFADDEPTSGSKATSPDGRAKARMQPLTAPFGTDNNAPWERETDRFSPDKQKISPDGVAELLDSLSMTNKYKKTSHDKKAPPVTMSKLLSHGYVEDKRKSPNDDDDDTSSLTSEQTSTIATEDVDDLE